MNQNKLKSRTEKFINCLYLYSKMLILPARVWLLQRLVLQHWVLLAIFTTPIFILAFTHVSGAPQAMISSVAMSDRPDTPLTRSEKVSRVFFILQKLLKEFRESHKIFKRGRFRCSYTYRCPQKWLFWHTYQCRW